MAKSIKETIREAFKSGKQMKTSAPSDPFFIGDEDPIDDGAMIDEMTTVKDEVDFADFEKDGKDSKQEPAQKGKSSDVTEGTESEAPPETSPDETSSDDKGTGTEDLAVEPESVPDIPVEKEKTQTGERKTWKVRTVDGDEEIDEQTLVNGYMMKKHYTRSQQMLHEKERRITELLSDPSALVNFAIENGVDLKPLVHAQSSVQELKIPPLPEYATPEMVQQHQIMTALAEQNNMLMKKVGTIETGFQQTMRNQKWNSVESQFEEERGDIPKNAKFAISLFMREGQKQYGKKYTIKDAIADLRIAEGDIYSRAFETPEGKKRIEAIKREAIAEYNKTKDKHKNESASGDILPPTKIQHGTEGKMKFKNAHEAAAAAKKRFGIFG